MRRQSPVIITNYANQDVVRLIKLLKYYIRATGFRKRTSIQFKRTRNAVNDGLFHFLLFYYLIITINDNYCYLFVNLGVVKSSFVSLCRCHVKRIHANTRWVFQVGESVDPLLLFCPLSTLKGLCSPFQPGLLQRSEGFLSMTHTNNDWWVTKLAGKRHFLFHSCVKACVEEWERVKAGDLIPILILDLRLREEESLAWGIGASPCFIYNPSTRETLTGAGLTFPGLYNLL